MIYKKPVLGFVTWNRMGITIMNLKYLLQSMDDFDLYIVDNGSKDDTAKYLKTLTDPRIKEIKYLDRNYGLIYALNYTISKRKKNQPFMNVDADVSIYTPEFISNCQKVYEKFPEAGIIGNTRPTYFKEKNSTYEEIIRDGVRFWKVGGILGCLMYFPSETLDKIGYFSEELCLADLEMAFRVNYLGKWLGYCPENLIKYYTPKCVGCHHKDTCSNPSIDNSRLFCYEDYAKNYRHGEFATQNREKFLDYRRNMTPEKIYTESIHDLSNPSRYNKEEAFKNFDFYK